MGRKGDRRIEAGTVAPRKGTKGQHGGPLAWTTPLLAVWLLVGLVTLSGCRTSLPEWWRNGLKVGPDYRRPPAPVAEEWMDANDPNVKPQGTDYSYWWSVFGDPILNDLVYEAYQQNLPLKIAGLRVLEARAQLGVAAGNLFPQQQQFGGTYTRTKISTSFFPVTAPFPILDYFDTWRFGLDAAWELDFWGRFRRAIESAQANLDAQIENYDDALVILQAEVAANYIQLRSLEERLELARKNVELQQETLRIIETRFKIGVVNELDVQQARANLAATEALIPTLQIEHRRVQNRLCTLLGLPPQDLRRRLAGPGKVPPVPPEVVVGVPADLLRRRPDVRSAERQAAAQCARIGVAEADLYPQFSISGTLGREARHFSQLWDLGSFTGSITPGFRWNVLNYGRILNNVDAEEARFQQAVIQYQETVLRAAEEVENAIVAFLREQVRAKSLEEGVRATERSVQLSVRQYEQGFVDYQRVLDSQRALVLLQDNLAESRGRVALNLIALYKALGGGWRMRYFDQPQPTRGPEAGESPPPAGPQPVERLPAPVTVPEPPGAAVPTPGSKQPSGP
ncbi:MAG TPA: efflux transporter outer membrane subunit [Planctomycetes bacterium]|nr:efflux transporter outer membrane subunit [Planctomycetota bacterium]